jgi:hypothetical protein
MWKSVTTLTATKKVDHRQKYVVKDPPEILVLQRNRWLSSKDFDKKNDELIHFTGDETIDLTSHLDKGRRKQFDNLKYPNAWRLNRIWTLHDTREGQ